MACTDSSKLVTSLEKLQEECEKLCAKEDFLETQRLYKEWIKTHQESLTLPENKQVYALALNNLGHAKYLAVDFENAEKDFSNALIYDPKLAVAYYNRGTIHYRMGYFAVAHKDFLEATRLNPSNEEFQIALEKCEQRTKS